MRIRSHLFRIALASAAPMLVFGLAITAFLVWNEFDTLIRAMQARTRALSSAVDAQLSAHVSTLRALANSAPLRQRDLSSFREIAQRALSSQPDWFDLVVIAPDGQQLMSTTRSQADSSSRALDRALLARVLARGQAEVGGVVPASAGEWAVPLYVPAVADGQPAVVVLALLKLASFDALLEAQQLPPGWILAIADHEKTFVARIPKVAPGSKTSPGFRDALTRGGEGTFRARSVEGVDTFQAYSVSPSTRWGVGIAIPAAEVYADAWGAGIVAIGGGLAAIGIAIALALAAGRRMGVAASALTNQAGALMRGEAPGQPSPSGVTEFDAAARAFDDASATIRSREAALMRTDAALRELAADLERRVAQRTEELTDANRQLQAFTYTVSHDLRAPLRGIQGYAQALQEDYGDSLGGEGKEFCERIVRAGERMENLIEDLLSYSRLAREEVVLRPLDLDPVVETALQQLADRVASTLAEVKIDRPLGTVLGHRPMLLQIFQNLLDNATKFVRNGTTPQVIVSSERSGNGLRITVADNGIGIEARNRERIFHVFERLHGDEAYPGTGIGLAIVKRACERMGGTCGLESEPGRGSRFWVELPAA